MYNRISGSLFEFFEKCSDWSRKIDLGTSPIRLVWELVTTALAAKTFLYYTNSLMAN